MAVLGLGEENPPIVAAEGEVGALQVHHLADPGTGGIEYRQEGLQVIGRAVDQELRSPG